MPKLIKTFSERYDICRCTEGLKQSGARVGRRQLAAARSCVPRTEAAAGRHLAAALEDVAFVEGSYGSLLLTEDISTDGVRFGHRGEALILTGPGLGIRVLEDRLRKYARKIVELS